VTSRTVDVVVPTHDTREVTLRCLRALEEEARNRDLSLRRILVDNASEDGTVDAVRRLLPDVHVIRNAQDAGYGKAVNRGVRSGDGEYVLILNSDAIARSGAVLALTRFLDQHPDFAVAAGRLVDEGSDVPQVGFSIRAFPTLSGQLALLLGFERHWPSNPISRRQSMRDFDYGRTQEVEVQPAGACVLCRRVDFEAEGGFDEAFYYWFEDVDLLRRLRERGRIAYVHDAVFEHLGGATFRHWSRADVIVARYQGLLRYFRKHHSRRDALVLRIVVAALAVLRALPLAIVDRSRARSYAQVIRLAARPSTDDGSVANENQALSGRVPRRELDNENATPKTGPDGQAVNREEDT
jgi:GT2 family glycosyltransferase